MSWYRRIQGQRTYRHTALCVSLVLVDRLLTGGVASKCQRCIFEIDPRCVGWLIIGCAACSPDR